MFTSRSAWIYGAALLGIFLCSGCAAPGSKPALSIDDQAEALSYFSLSLLAENAGDLDTALAYRKEAIRRDPSEKMLYSSAVAAAVQLEQNDEALRLARRFRNERPKALQPRILEAQVCALTGSTDEAEALFRQARKDFPKEPGSAIALARFLIAKENHPEAIRVLEAAQKDHPEHADILYLLGTLYVSGAREMDDPPDVQRAILEGIELLEDALAQNPDNPQHWKQLGYACLAVKDIAKAQTAFKKAREQLPEDIQLARQLLDIYILNGDIEPALALCEELRRFTRTDPELWFQYLAEKIPDDQQDALTRYLEDFLQEHPHSAAMYYTKLGSLYIEQDKLPDAKRILQKARAIHPENSRIKTASGYLHLQQEQYEEAYQAFRKVRTGPTNPEWVSNPLFAFNFVLAAQQTGRIEEATDALSAAYENDPEILNLYLRALSSGKPPVSAESATDLLQRFHTRSPDAINALYYLTYLLAEQKKYEDALNNAQRFEELSAGTTGTNLLDGTFYYQYGALHERTGNLVGAEPWFRKAIELGPSSVAAAAQNYIAYMWAERGEKLEMALGLIQQALAVEPENAAFIDTLGWIYYMQGCYEEALVQLKKASELIQDDPEVWKHLGDTYLKLGDRRRAIRKWEKGLQADPDHQPLIERLDETGISTNGFPAPEDSPADTPSRP